MFVHTVCMDAAIIMMMAWQQELISSLQLLSGSTRMIDLVTPESGVA